MTRTLDPSPLSTPARVARSRGVRITATVSVAGLAIGAIVTAGGGTAGAATAPAAQSVGRFLDGAAGGMPLQSIVDLKDARAKAAPNTSKRQGVNATLFNAADVPIGNGLKLPGGGVFNLGASNQIAVAKTDGYSYGAAGAVENNGGVQLTDKNGAYPSDATINLSGAALNGVTIPGLPASSLPGLPSSLGGIDAASLGGVTARIGAVQALAQTETGGKSVKPQSSVADVQLAIGSPALGALLTQLNKLFQTNLTSGLTTINGTLAAVVGALINSNSCSLTAPASTDLSFEGGAVTISASDATITVDVKKLVQRALGLNISHLSTSNFDLIKFVVQQLPTILSTGLTKIVTGITNSLTKQFNACSVALTGALGQLVGGAISSQQLTAALSTLQSALLGAVSTISDPLVTASSGGLATLADGLTGVVDIGLNVQAGPKIQPHNQQYKYYSQLAKTPDQATSIVKGQSLVRAIEIDLLDASAGAASGGLPGGLPTLPATSAVAARQLAGAHTADAASGNSVVTLALANAAAGPSVAAPTVVVTPTAPANPTLGGTTLPTGVPAGAAGHSDGGSPLLPVGVLLVGLVLAGGGVLSLRMRGKFGR